MVTGFENLMAKPLDDCLSKGLSDACPPCGWFCRAPRAGVGQATKEEIALLELQFRRPTGRELCGTRARPEGTKCTEAHAGEAA